MTGVEEAAVIPALANGAAAAGGGAMLGAPLPAVGVVGGALGPDALAGAIIPEVLGGSSALYDGGLALTQGLLADTAPVALEASAPLTEATMQGIAANGGIGLGTNGAGTLGGMETLGGTGSGISSTAVNGINPMAASQATTYTPGFTSGTMSASAPVGANYAGLGGQYMVDAVGTPSQILSNMSFADKASLALNGAMNSPNTMMNMGMQGAKMMAPQGQQPGMQGHMMQGSASGLDMPRQAKPFANFSPYAQMSNYGQGFSAAPMKKRMPSGLL